MKNILQIHALNNVQKSVAFNKSLMARIQKYNGAWQELPARFIKHTRLRQRIERGVLFDIVWHGQIELIQLWKDAKRKFASTPSKQNRVITEHAFVLMSKGKRYIEEHHHIGLYSSIKLCAS